MAHLVRLFLTVEAASFVVASLVHAGVLVEGYAHRSAAIAEAVIAAGLLVGLGLMSAWPDRVRTVALVAQGFALLGTLVGLFTIAIGVGPRTVPDVAYHLGIALVLAWGLVVAARERSTRDRDGVAG